MGIALDIAGSAAGFAMGGPMGAMEGFSAASAIGGGIAQKQSADYNAAIATDNASIATQNSKFAAQEGEQAASTTAMKTRAEEGALVANQGASGVQVGGGSFGDVQQSEKEVGELNALTVRSNAARQAYGYQTQAAGDTTQASLDKMEGKQAEIAGFGKAATTIGFNTALGNSATAGGNAWGSYMGGNSLNAASTYATDFGPEQAGVQYQVGG